MSDNSPDTPQERSRDYRDYIDELAAGYVLGNLSSDEATALQTYVEQHPEFASEIDRLYDVLGVIPYALPAVELPHHLREQILLAAPQTASRAPTELPTRLPDQRLARSRNDRHQGGDQGGDRGGGQSRSQRRPLHHGRWLGAIAASTVLVLGAIAWNLHQNLVTIQATLHDAQTQIGQLEAALEAEVEARVDGDMPMIQPNATLASTWQIHQLINDHRMALQGYGAQYSVHDDEIREIVRQFEDDFAFAPRLPVLSDPNLELVSGTFCRLGRIPGFRFTYQTRDGSQISLYQVGRPGDSLTLPEVTHGQLLVRQTNQPDVILWSHEGYDYAVVAEMPEQQLDAVRAIRYEVISQ